MTLFAEKFWNERWLAPLLANKNIGIPVIHRAQKGIKINAESQFEIFVWLLEKNYIRLWEYTIPELFK